MIELSDEILNRYLDGELEPAELLKVNELLKESHEARMRLSALQAVHISLKEMNAYSPSEGFTSLIMSKLYIKSRKGQKIFIYSISGFFILLALIITGTAAYLIINSQAFSPSGELSRNVISYSETLARIIRNVFSGSGISIFGSVLSLAIIIFGYFFFEFQKNLKAKAK